MKKYQRAKRKIQRDKELKVNKFLEKFDENDNFFLVITHQHYVEALYKCRKGVTWKGSVQLYTQHGICEIDTVIEILLSGKLPPYTSNKIIILSERGKLRAIVPITIKDRMTQRVLCDNALVPVLQSKLIYDNGASMKGKGVDFTRRRLQYHLESAIKEYGSNFYVMTFDFKSYFDSIPHQTCENVLRKYFTDERIIATCMGIIKSYQRSQIKKMKDSPKKRESLRALDNNELRGMCLGSQISQIMALVVPNSLDHYIKDKRGVKHYIRYMDDGVLFSDSKEFLQELYEHMKVIAAELGLSFNEKKTHIGKISKGFTFLKVRYRVTDTGKIVKTLTKQGIVRMRRKLKKFKHLVDEGRMTMDDVYNSMQSWYEHTRVAMAYHARKNMVKLYNELYDGYRLTKKYQHTKGGKNGEILQIDKWREFRWGSDAA